MNMKKTIQTMKKLIFPFLLLVSCISCSQNRHFEDYEFHEMPINTNRANIDSILKASFKDFSDYVKDCNFPDFKVTTINGDTIELSKLKGKVVVINFWFVECPPCIAELHGLNKLVDTFKTKDVVFIAMSKSTKRNIITSFLPNNTFKFQIVPNPDTIGNKKIFEDKFKLSFGWPMTYVLDKKGKVKFVTSGARVDDASKDDKYYELKPIIEKYL